MNKYLISLSLLAMTFGARAMAPNEHELGNPFYKLRLVVVRSGFPYELQQYSTLVKKLEPFQEFFDKFIVYTLIEDNQDRTVQEYAY